MIMKIDVSFLDNLDLLIKKGESEKVQRALKALKTSEVPRALLASIAKISLRVGEPRFALSLLRPLIHSETPLALSVSFDEQIQYGMCLKQLGASDHALKVFRSVNADHCPEVLLYEAITLFTQWRYQEAIPKLERYLDSDLVGSYQKMIGKINLASALIFVESYADANEILSALAEEAKDCGHHLLFGNALELLSQILIYKKEYAGAEEIIQKASVFMEKSTPVYKLFLEKWSAIAQLYQSKSELSSLRNLNRVRDQAISLRHWESVRDCDFFFAVCKRDEHLFQRLYFGTPYEDYRQRLIRYCADFSHLPEYFDWRGNAAHLHALDGKLEALDLGKKSGDQNIRLLKALSRDFYAPTKPYALYLNLFSDESLDPEAALPRIFSAVSRAKKWLKSQSIPIEIENSEAGYKLTWTGPYVLRVPSGLELQKVSVNGLEALKKHYKDQSFSSSEAARFLELSQRSLVRMIKDAVSDQVLEVQGQGPSTRYKFRSAKAS